MEDSFFDLCALIIPVDGAIDIRIIRYMYLLKDQCGYPRGGDRGSDAALARSSSRASPADRGSSSVCFFIVLARERNG